MLLFRSLRHRLFLFLWLGQTISRVGDSVYEIALAWWVLQKTGSAALMGTVLIFAIAPSILFYLFGGVIADQVSRVGVMLASDIGRGVIALLVSTLAFIDRLEVWEILVASLLFGFVEAFFQPAFAALVPQLVPEADWPSANSLSSISTNLGRVLGPSLGAAIIALVSLPVAFALNGMSFFLSVIFLIPLVTLKISRDHPKPRTSLWREMREGITTVTDSSWLLTGIGAFALMNITLVGPYSVAMPFLISENLHAGVETLGLIYAMFPLGYLIGGVGLGGQQKIHRRGILMYATGMIAAIALGVYGLLPPLWVLIVAALANGATLEIGHLVWTNTLQESVPNERLGRVVSIDNMGSFALLPIGFALAGWATEVFGAPFVFIIGGAFTVILNLMPLLISSIRNFD